jgi:mannose-6-phosphate isomerase-like protein (cupin superfamily)
VGATLHRASEDPDVLLLIVHDLDQREEAGMELPSGAIVLPPKGGRHYDMGTLHAVFKADEAETQERYSVSEWWLQPNVPGPGAHTHEDNDEVFYVLQGRPDLLVGNEWVSLEAGGFALVPHGVSHDFRNTTGEEAGLLNLFIPGGFERDMPAIVKWFEEHR